MAEVLGEEAGRPLHTRDIATVVRCLVHAVDDVEALVGMVFIQPHLEIPRLRSISTEHHMPFDVKDTVWRSA